jgi:opacity protein-like surface antigen
LRLRSGASTLAIAIAASSWLAPGHAGAQVTDEPNPVIFPDPSKFARGLYTEGELGSVVLFGPAGGKVGPGFAIGTRLGYDLNRLFAVQLHALGSTHQTSFPGMPQDDQLLQLYQGTVEAKATIRFGQTSVFVEGGLGAARLSSNLLSTVLRTPDGTAYLTRWRTGFTAGGGAGFDYHSLSRHFSVGVRCGFFWLRDISGSSDLIATTYLRYTF